MGPNVLLVVLDTARADAFEPYGARQGATPTVAQLAREGVGLPAVFATASWTLPSHASLFTGLLPRTLGLGQAPGGAASGARPVLEAARDRMLPEVLRKAGYATAGISTNLWVADYSGFATGFDRFHVVDSGRQRRIQGGALQRARWAVEGARARVDDGAAAAERILGAWIDAGPTRPFFWFVNLSECHSPYLPPRPYNDLPLWQRMRAADEARSHLTLEAIWTACGGRFDVPGDALDRMRHLYRRSILAMDDWLARVLERMAGAG